MRTLTPRSLLKSVQSIFGLGIYHDVAFKRSRRVLTYMLHRLLA